MDTCTGVFYLRTKLTYRYIKQAQQEAGNFLSISFLLYFGYSILNTFALQDKKIRVI